MEWIRSVQEAIAWLEEHLLDDVRFEDAARHVHMSGYEFHRAFSFLTGMTVAAYVRSRRLSLAARELMETDARVTDLALKYGYETPESFTKAFTRFHGVAPRQAREASARLVLFNPLVIQLTVKGGKSMDYRIVRKPTQHFLALVRSFPNTIINDDDAHDIPDFWDECHRRGLVEPLRNLRPEGRRDLYGLCAPASAGEDSFDYGIGILLDDATATFDAAAMARLGYRPWTVDEGTYAVFDCMGADGDCISDTWKKFYREFLPQMGYAAEAKPDFEIYFERSRPGLFCELWIPIRKL